MKILLMMFAMSFSTYAISDDFFWKLADGSKAPETQNQKSVNGFGGWLIVTPDKDWEEKWNTPSEHVPHFAEASEVKIGEELTILPFFANPKLDKSLNFELTCTIQVEKPDRTYSINEKNIPCASGKMEMSPMSIFLTQTVVKYIGEKGDPFGVWTVHFEIKDVKRGVSVPLKTSFKLVK